MSRRGASSIKAAKLIILNGASGSGKTTTAAALSARLDAAWIHPDELWDTPNMQAKEIFTHVAEMAAQTDPRLPTIVDCQIRPAAISQILSNAGINSWVSVLHHCPDPVRQQRLLARTWRKQSSLAISSLTPPASLPSRSVRQFCRRSGKRHGDHRPRLLGIDHDC